MARLHRAVVLDERRERNRAVLIAVELSKTLPR